jgi:hypothetical protein
VFIRSVRLESQRAKPKPFRIYYVFVTRSVKTYAERHHNGFRFAPDLVEGLAGMVSDAYRNGRGHFHCGFYVNVFPEQKIKNEGCGATVEAE